MLIGEQQLKKEPAAGDMALASTNSWWRKRDPACHKLAATKSSRPLSYTERSYPPTRHLLALSRSCGKESWDTLLLMPAKEGHKSKDSRTVFKEDYTVAY